MDRNYIIYNNTPFTLIWHLAFGAFGKKCCEKYDMYKIKRDFFV